ncbi:hypothetical protein [Phenylobacterium sp.]|uniref:hypothetical protein n=1 Tax=Phenylobacterium sp. TaxID=1871053 RepID=UPI0035B2960B
MVSPVAISVFKTLPVHRAAVPRPVELAPAPGSLGPARTPPAKGPAPAGPLMAGATASQLMGVLPEWTGGASALAAARAAGAYGLASMPEVATLTPTAPKWAYEEVSGLGYFPGNVSASPASMTAYVREEIAAARTAAREERRMSEAEGVEVRLAYDPNTDQAVALRPGDAGYDEVRGARAAFERMRWDVGRMGLNAAEFEDLLRL